MKEGLREHWKDLADALNYAQYIYAIRTDTTASNNSLRYMRSQIDDVRALVLSNGKLPSLQSLPENEIIMRNLGRLDMQTDDVEASLANIGILVGKLSKQDTNRERLRGLKKTLAEVREGSKRVIVIATPTDLPKTVERRKGRLTKSSPAPQMRKGLSPVAQPRCSTMPQNLFRTFWTLNVSTFKSKETPRLALGMRGGGWRLEAAATKERCSQGMWRSSGVGERQEIVTAGTDPSDNVPRSSKGPGIKEANTLPFSKRKRRLQCKVKF